MRAGDELDLGTPHLQTGVGGGAISSAQQLETGGNTLPNVQVSFSLNRACEILQ